MTIHQSITLLKSIAQFKVLKAALIQNHSSI